MKDSNLGNTKGFESTIDKFRVIEAEITDLITKCKAPMAPSDSVAEKVHNVAEQLLAAVGKFVDVGRDLKSVTSCMTEVAGEADDCDLSHFPHILAWADWTRDLTSDAFHAIDDLIHAIGGLIGAKAAPSLKGGL